MKNYFQKIIWRRNRCKNRQKISETALKLKLKANLVYSSNHKFAIDAHDKLVEQANIALPEAFLKRWLIAINKELTVEQIENEFDSFISDLKWQLIKDVIIKENDIKVSVEETQCICSTNGTCPVQPVRNLRYP